MSSNAIFLGAAGMRLQSQKISVLGNNIANSTSIAYKAGGMSFIDTYRGYTGQFANGNVKNVGNGVKIGNIFSDWTDGAIKETAKPGDLAWNGDGFFHVVKAGTDYYTRAGDFSLVDYSYIDSTQAAGQYVLARPDGSLLQGTDDAGTTTGAIVFSSFPSSWAMAANGNITVTGTYDNDSDPLTPEIPITVANSQIHSARFSNRDGLVREDNGLYSATIEAGMSTGVPLTKGIGSVIQGALEMSNVDLVNEFTDLVLTQRAYSANSKTITTASEMLQEVLNLKR